MARKTKEEALETRNRIIDTAEQVFYRQGVSRTSLTDIATAAGVSRGAIYWHFKNKSDLFTAMFDRVKLPLDELMEATLDHREPDPLGRIADVLVHCLRDTLLDPQRRQILDILFFKCEFTEDMSEVVTRHQTMVREGRSRMEAGLNNAVDKGQLPARLDTRMAASLMHAMITGLLNDWLFMPQSIDLEHNAQRVVQACLDMLRASPQLILPATPA